MEDSVKVEHAEYSTDQLKEWQTPELIVEDVEKQTQGGTTGDVHPVDDAWYS